MAVQAGYLPSSYGRKSSIAGYAAQLQPAVSVSVLPSYGHRYGAGRAYGAAPPYAAIPSYGAAKSYRSGVDAEALGLASLVFALPSPGGPNEAIINVPQYHTTSYSAPAVVLAPGHYNDALSGSSAAAAASNVKSASSGYGPAPASVGYAPAVPVPY